MSESILVADEPAVLAAVGDALAVHRYRVHTASAGDRTPILVLTARTATQDRIDGLDAGADDYLIKPFDLGELLARVAVVLARRALATR